MQNLGCHFALTEVRSEAGVALEVLDEGLEYGLEAQHGRNWGLKKEPDSFQRRGRIGCFVCPSGGSQTFGYWRTSCCIWGKATAASWW